MRRTHPMIPTPLISQKTKAHTDAMDGVIATPTSAPAIAAQPANLGERIMAQAQGRFGNAPANGGTCVCGAKWRSLCSCWRV